jgi:hypothetical protein
MRPTLFGWFLAAAAAIAAPAAAQELSLPLTPAEVECTELQLQRLLLRVDPRLPSLGILTNLFLAPGAGGGSYQGLLVMSQRDDLAPRQPELQLAFHLDPVRSLLLNPARPPLGQVSLTREDPASNLVTAADQALAVVLDPGIPPRPDVTSPLDLVIDNVAGPAGHATSTKPGRGLERDGLLTACTDRLTAFDRRVFALLQRLVKVETLVAVGTPMPVSSQITVFRGAEPYVYRLNAYNGDIRKVAVEVRIVPAADGRLATAALHMLPPCSGPFPDFSPLPGCTDKISTRALQTRILLVRPVFGGVETWDRDAPGGGQIYHIIPASRPWITDSTADLAALLADTAWNGGE